MRIAEQLASGGADLVGGDLDSGAARRRRASSAAADIMNDASVGVATGCDMAALCPSDVYARPERRAEDGAQIWIAAVVLSLSLHAAGLVAVFVWPKPSPAPSDSTPIEIVVEFDAHAGIVATES